MSAHLFRPLLMLGALTSVGALSLTLLKREGSSDHPQQGERAPQSATRAVTLTQVSPAWLTGELTGEQLTQERAYLSELLVEVNNVPLPRALLRGLTQSGVSASRERFKALIELELTRQAFLLSPTLSDELRADALKRLPPAPYGAELTKPPPQSISSWPQRTSSALTELLTQTLPVQLQGEPTEVSVELTHAQEPSALTSELNRELLVISLPQQTSSKGEAMMLTSQLQELKRAILKGELSPQEALRRRSPQGAPLRGVQSSSTLRASSHPSAHALLKATSTLKVGELSEPIKLEGAVLLVKVLSTSHTLTPAGQLRSAERLEALQRQQAALQQARQALYERATRSAKLLIPTAALLTPPSPLSASLTPLTLTSPPPTQPH